MTFTTTIIGISVIAIGFFICIMYLMVRDQMEIIKGLELENYQLREQTNRLFVRNEEFAEGYEKLEEDYKGAVASLRMCESKLNDN